MLEAEKNFVLPKNIDLKKINKIIEEEKIIELIPYISECIYLDVNINYFRDHCQ